MLIFESIFLKLRNICVLEHILFFVKIQYLIWSLSSFKLTIVEDVHFEVWLFGHHHFWSIGKYPLTASICFYIFYEFIQLNFIPIFQILRWGGGSHVTSQTSFIWTIADIWWKINAIRPRLHCEITLSINHIHV